MANRWDFSCKINLLPLSPLGARTTQKIVQYLSVSEQNEILEPPLTKQKVCWTRALARALKTPFCNGHKATQNSCATKKQWRMLRGEWKNSNARMSTFCTVTFTFLNIYFFLRRVKERKDGEWDSYCAFQGAMQTRPTCTSSRLHTSDVARQLTSCIFSSCLDQAFHLTNYPGQIGMHHVKQYFFNQLQRIFSLILDWSE